MVYKALEKEPVPMTLPPNLIPPSKRGGAPAPVRTRLSSSGSTGSSMPGAVPVIPAQVAAAMATSGPSNSVINIGGGGGPVNFGGVGSVSPYTILVNAEPTNLI